METAKQELLNADKALAHIFVRGEDVYTLMKARRALRLAFAALEKEGEDDASRA